MENLTLEDAKQALRNMKKNKLVQMKEFVKLIPVVGTDLYLQALLEGKKIEVFKKLLEQASKETVTEQREFLNEFSFLISENKSKQKHL